MTKNKYKYPDGTVIELTYEEASDNGFCPNCGYFVWGIEIDHHSLNQHGLCWDCFEQFESETGAYDDDDDDFQFDPEY